MTEKDNLNIDKIKSFLIEENIEFDCNLLENDDTEAVFKMQGSSQPIEVRYVNVVLRDVLIDASMFMALLPPSITTFPVPYTFPKNGKEPIYVFRLLNLYE